MGDTSYAVREGEELVPVVAPIPEATHRTSNKAQSIQLSEKDLIDPQAQPSLDHADAKTLLTVIKGALPPIFDMFRENLTSMRTRLAQPPPVGDPSLAAEILSVFVEIVAGAAVGEIGTRIASHVRSAFGEVAGTAAGDALKSIAKSKGAAVGSWFKKQASREPTNPAEPSRRAAEPGGSLLEEFISQERLAINGRAQAANTQMALADVALPGLSRDRLQSLADGLSALVSDPGLSGWFEHKVAMEWLNFCARLSLEGRDDLGTNSITSDVSANLALRQLDGFVDITIEAPETIWGTAGLTVKDVNAGNAGAAATLRNAPYSLATLPVYRRIWVANGPSKISGDPVMLVAPDGEIQADLQSTVLAAIGTGIPSGAIDTATTPSDNSAVRRFSRATEAAAGARALLALLSTSNLEGMR